MDIVSWTVLVVGVVGLAGTVAEVVALVRRCGRGLALAGVTLRIAGIVALFGIVLAGRGRADFQDLVFVVYGMFAGVALWIAAAICDVVLLLRHLLKKGAA